METASRSPRATRENLKQALTVIDEIRVALEIPESTIQTATVLYRRLLDEEDKYYGWRIDDVAITAVFIACQMDDVPRESSEFTTIENHPIETKILFRRVKTVKEALDLEVSGNTNPVLHIDRWEDDLNVSESILEKSPRNHQQVPRRRHRQRQETKRVGRSRSVRRYQT